MTWPCPVARGEALGGTIPLVECVDASKYAGVPNKDQEEILRFTRLLTYGSSEFVIGHSAKA